MASEFATRVIETTINVKDVLVQDTLDAELQEVREVLEGLRDGLCWCGVDQPPDTIAPAVYIPHSDACQRARALMERLAVSEVGP